MLKIGLKTYSKCIAKEHVIVAILFILIYILRVKIKSSHCYDIYLDSFQYWSLICNEISPRFLLRWPYDKYFKCDHSSPSASSVAHKNCNYFYSYLLPTKPSSLELRFCLIHFIPLNPLEHMASINWWMN